MFATELFSFTSISDSLLAKQHIIYSHFVIVIVHCGSIVVHVLDSYWPYNP
jgi:hypothetical protein